MTRREFLRLAMAATIAPAAGEGAGASGALPRRKLGRTGVEVSIVGLGGFHMGMQRDPEESVRIVRAESCALEALTPGPKSALAR